MVSASTTCLGRRASELALASLPPSCAAAAKVALEGGTSSRSCGHMASHSGAQGATALALFPCQLALVPEVAPPPSSGAHGKAGAPQQHAPTTAVRTSSMRELMRSRRCFSTVEWLTCGFSAGAAANHSGGRAAGYSMGGLVALPVGPPCIAAH